MRGRIKTALAVLLAWAAVGTASCLPRIVAELQDRSVPVQTAYEGDPGLSLTLEKRGLSLGEKLEVFTAGEMVALPAGTGLLTQSEESAGALAAAFLTDTFGDWGFTPETEQESQTCLYWGGSEARQVWCWSVTCADSAGNVYVLTLEDETGAVFTLYGGTDLMHLAYPSLWREKMGLAPFSKGFWEEEGWSALRRRMVRKMHSRLSQASGTEQEEEDRDITAVQMATEYTDSDSSDGLGLNYYAVALPSAGWVRYDTYLELDQIWCRISALVPESEAEESGLLIESSEVVSEASDPAPAGGTP